MRRVQRAGIVLVLAALLAAGLLAGSSSGKPSATTLTVFFGVGVGFDDTTEGGSPMRLQGHGSLTGPGTALGAERLTPVPGTGRNGGAPRLVLEDKTHHRLVLTVTAARNVSISEGRQTLLLSVEVTDSTLERCRERTATRSGVRGTVHIVRKLQADDVITLELACSLSREWRSEREKAVLFERTLKKTTPPKPKGAWPGGTATKMTLTIGGVSATTDLKTNKQTPGDPVLKAKSTSTLSGSVSLNGTLPKGWTIAVFHLTGTDILLTSPTGGAFSGVKPFSTTFDAFTRPGAYVCATKVPPLCAPAAQANISIDWDP